MELLETWNEILINALIIFLLISSVLITCSFWLVKKLSPLFYKNLPGKISAPLKRHWKFTMHVFRKNSINILTIMICIILSVFATTIDTLSIKLVLIISIILLLIREEFPFSNFPMYRSFSNTPYYIYIRDDKDNLLSTEEIFGVSSGYLKKVYDFESRKIASKKGKKLKELEDQELVVAGKYVMDFLFSLDWEIKNIERPKELKLYHVSIYGKDGEIREQERFILSAN